jgi:16S rRNA (cytidine1402-2'-O)-methyltransferase
MSKPVVYLIPTLLDEEGINAIPSYVVENIKQCRVFFVENERTARRFLKKVWKEIVIDDYEWYNMSDTLQVSDMFKQKITEQINIGIISEAGCPGIADPGQQLVALAHEMNAEVKPLVGPSSILLALMASGMNGQHFQFVGYLPVKDQERIKAIKELESLSQKKKSTQIFIETPYRNNQLIDALLKNCRPSTRLCIAVDLTSGKEWIRTKTIGEWKTQKPDIHKRPAIFCLLA